MVLPWLIGAAVVATAGKAISEACKKQEAEEIVEDSKQVHHLKIKELEEEGEITDQFIQDYLKVHQKVYFNQIQNGLILLNKRPNSVKDKSKNIKSIKFLRSSYEILSNNQQTASGNEGQSVSGFDGAAATFVGGTAAVLVGQGVVSFARNFGVASTGTAISSLSGAARNKAALAFLGGGAKAIGGGGIALGSLVVAGLAIGTFAVVGNYMLSSEGEEALNQAHSFAACVDNSILEIDKQINFLKQLQQHIHNLTQLVYGLESDLIQHLRKIRSKKLTPEVEIVTVEKSSLLIKALEKVWRTPLLKRPGELNPESKKLLDSDFLKRVQEEINIENALITIGKTLTNLTILTLVGLIGYTRWNQEQQWTQVKAVMQNELHSEHQTDLDSLQNSKEQLQTTITTFEPVASFPGCKSLQSKIAISENVANFLGCRSFAVDKLRVRLETVEQTFQLQSQVENKIKSAQALAMEAAVIVQNQPHPIESLQEAQFKWEEAIELLSEISNQELMQAEIQQHLEEYKNNYQTIAAKVIQEENALNSWEKAIQLGRETAEMVQNSPHPLSVWRKAHSKCNEAVTFLTQISPTTSIYNQAQAKLINYKNTCANLNKRIQVEQKAVNIFTDVEKLDQSIRSVIKTTPYTASDLESVLLEIRQLLTLLNKIPSGTIVSEKAQSLKTVYNSTQNKVIKKIEDIEGCPSFSSDFCVYSKIPISFNSY